MAATLQGFPKLDSSFCNPDLTITIPWYRFLVTLWQKTGGSNVPISGSPLYNVSLGAAEQVQVLGVSPFVFQAPHVGFMTAAGGEVELNRTGTWRKVSLQGGSFWMMNQDLIRVTWFGLGPPEVVWWPTA